MASSVHEQIALIQLVIAAQENALDVVQRHYAENPHLATDDKVARMASADHTLEVLRDIEALLCRQLHH